LKREVPAGPFSIGREKKREKREKKKKGRVKPAFLYPSIFQKKKKGGKKEGSNLQW